MSKKDYKNLVAQITKMATPPPDMGGNPAPTPRQTGGGGGGGGVPTLNQGPPQQQRWTGPVGNSNIKNMQVAMQRLADAVIKDSTSGNNFRNPNDAVTQQADANTVKFKKSFNDFIAEQYSGMVPEGYKGVEWSQDSTVQNRPDKQVGQSDLYELNAMLNTMKRIGSPNSEFKADGFWQFRTNNALMNMMSFAYALLSMEGDFGIESGEFAKQDLDAMKSLLSGYEVDDSGVNGEVKLSNDEKSSRAAKMVPLLNKLTKLYLEFRTKVSTQSQFVPIIEGRRSFDKYNASGNNPDFLTEQDKALISNNPKVNGVRVTGYKPNSNDTINITEIPLSALQNADSFKAYLKQIGWNDQRIQLYAKTEAENIAKQLDAYGTDNGVGSGFSPSRI